MAQKGIGRLFALGIAKEATRGTAISAATYWLPFEDLGFEEKFENATQDQAHGVIEDHVGEMRVKNYADGTFKVPLTDQSVGLLFYSIFGAHAAALHSGETTVYDHTFTVGESAQHQSLTAFVHDPLAGTDYAHANGVIHKMDLDVELKKIIDLSFSIRGQKGVAAGSQYTPALLAENYFVPQYMTYKYATTVAGLGSATAIALKSFKMTVDEDLEDQDVLGSVAPADFLNKEFKVDGTIEAIYQNLTDFKAIALATPNVPQAMQVAIADTDVIIGSTTHPSVTVTFDQVYFSDYTRPVKIKDLVYQTVKFKAAYNTTNSEMLKVVLTNTVATY